MKAEIDVVGDISGVDKRLLAKYQERTEYLYSKFPQAIDYRKTYGYKYEFSYDKTARFSAEASNGFTFGYEADDAIAFAKSDIESQLSGEAVRGSGAVNRVIDHEYGHNVDHSIRSMFTEYNDDYKEYLRDVRSLYGKSGMSEYATTNEEELFAEAFAAYVGGEKTEFAKGMEKILIKYGVIK